MLSEFEAKVGAFIEQYGLLNNCSRIVLAVSGGADSTALLHTFWSYRAAGLLRAEVVCAHINHGLRGSAADADESFVKAQARKLEMPFVSSQIDVKRFAKKHKLSIETAARQMRIDGLLEIAGENQCDCVATGHQKNDNAETIIQRLSRGTGLRGLVGIWPIQTFGGNIRFIRPLLCVTREQIIDYLKRRNLEYHQDATNDDCSYRRNFIRHRLLPLLQEQASTSLVESFFKLSQAAQRYGRYISIKTEQSWKQVAGCSEDGVVIDLKGFVAEPEPVKVEIIRRALATVGSGEKDLTREHYQRIIEFSGGGISGKQLELPGGFTVWREYRSMVFAGQAGPAHSKAKTSISVDLKIPGQTRYADYFIDATILDNEPGAFERFREQKDEFVEWFDVHKLIWPLRVRPRIFGDRFQPLGQERKKRVGKFLTSRKIPLELRQNICVITDKEKIIWLCPVRISEQAKVTEQTRKILQLKIAGVV
jgi:tRNA(Ile)-lysidine synthase